MKCRGLLILLRIIWYIILNTRLVWFAYQVPAQTVPGNLYCGISYQRINYTLLQFCQCYLRHFIHYISLLT